MKNPLNKRFGKELKSEFGKYLVLFLFLASMIAIVSGANVAGSSMKSSFDEAFVKYNTEDGNFELRDKASKSVQTTLEEEKITLYENFYIEEETDFNTTMRLFKDRKEVNKICLMEGKIPANSDEIAIDRMHADNNELKIGDAICVGGKKFVITGLVAFPDYSCLYQSPTDLMFDALKFGVGVVTDACFDSFEDSYVHYNYSWKYDVSPKDDEEAKTMAQDLLKALSTKVMFEQYIPAYNNQAIHFAGNDIGRDGQMFNMFLYIVVVIIAFIFAITTSNTIAKEATVIGTLRASGYTKGELIRHYMMLPVLVTLVAALVGNVFGYTVMEDFASNLYYNSYSLTTYTLLFNEKAFVNTTVIPVVLMILINFLILESKMRLSPLRFIRRDIHKRQRKKAIKLNTRIEIMKRFKLRILFQNMPNYVTIVVGVFFATVIMIFGMGMKPIMRNYQEVILENTIAEYQYILKMPTETKCIDAEKYSVASLKTPERKGNSESVNLYGIIKDSRYIDLDFDEKTVYISNAYAEKYKVEAEDTIVLLDEYSEETYEFRVKGVYEFPSAVCVFMDIDVLNEVFEYEDGFFNGFFSKQKIEDIDSKIIASVITLDDYTKVSRQLLHSMGDFMSLFVVVGVIMYMLIIYLLSKIVVEKNSQSISMIKILGYTKSEINHLYVITTAVVVIFSLVVTLPIVDALIPAVFEVAFSGLSGWLPCEIPKSVYVYTLMLGVLCYGMIAFLQMKQVSKIPMKDALKNVE